MAYNKISSETKSVLAVVEDKMEKNSAGLEKKIAQLKKDLTAAKKRSLAKTALKSLELSLSETKQAQKNLLKTGFEELLRSEVDKKSKLHEKMLKNMIKKVDALFDHKLNATVFKCLCDLSNFLTKANEKERQMQTSIKKANPGISELVIVLEIFASQNNICQNVENKLSGLQIKNADNFSVNDQYPLITRRAQLAPLCVKSAREEWSSSLDYVDDFFDNMDMMSMFISDARNHYNLGVQILHGSPQSIEAARSMDTASRDGIPEKVWDFARDEIYDNTVFGPKALKAHRQKILEKNAQKLNRKIHKEIGGQDGRKKAVRKI